MDHHVKITRAEYDRRANVAYGFDLSGAERDNRISTFNGAHSNVVIVE